MRCLRTIAHIKWQEHVPNTEVLKRCCINGMEAILQMSQLRWCGHVIRMDDSRIPKQTFYGQLHHGSKRPGGQYKRYKDRLKDTLKQCEITPSDLESLARDRTTWRTTCRNAVSLTALWGEASRPYGCEATATQDWTTIAWDLPMFHLRSDVSIQDRTIFTQQDPSLVTMRPVVSTAQSI